MTTPNRISFGAIQVQVLIVLGIIGLFIALLGLG